MDFLANFIEPKGETTMNKWGVRLISVYLSIWAITNAYKIISGHSKNTFFGLGFNLFGHTLDFLAWAEVAFLVYIGFQLFRFQSGGRNSALFLFWWLSISSAGFLIWMIVVTANDLYKGEIPSLALNLNNPTWFGELRGFSAAWFYFVVILVFYFIPTYFLMRKDVKQLFEKPVTIEEPATILPGETS